MASVGHSRPVAAFSIEILQQNLGGDLPLAHTILEIFLDDAPHMIATMQEAFQSSSQAELERAAHTLKSNAHLLGAESLGALCASIERQAKQGGIQDVEPLLAQMEQAYERVRRVVVAYLNHVA